jgi:hypothetical protein
VYYRVHFPASESIIILCTDRAPLDTVVTRIGEWGINANCERYSKPALLHLDSLGFEGDYMCEVSLECE